MFESVVIGDLHLDGLGFLPDGNRLIMKEVEKAEAYAVRQGISQVIYTGDIGDKTVLSYDAHELLLDQWRKHEGLLERHVILGNHDFSRKGKHSLSILEKALEGTNTHIYTKPTSVKLGGVNINFLPYPYPNEELPRKFDLKNSLNFSHFEVAGSMRDNGTASNTSVTVPASSHWIMGHLHTPHDVSRVHYVGTLFQRNFGESLPKSFSVVKARYKDDVLQVRKVRVDNKPSFTLVNLDIQNRIDLEKVTDDPNTFYKLFVRSNVTLPPTFLAVRPNVLKVQAYKTESERTALLEDQVIREVTTSSFDAFEGLENFLDYNYPDLSDESRERIFELQKHIKETLS